MMLEEFKFVIETEVEENPNSSLTTYLQTSGMPSFDVHMDKSANICTLVEQILLYL